MDLRTGEIKPLEEVSEEERQHYVELLSNEVEELVKTPPSDRIEKLKKLRGNQGLEPLGTDQPQPAGIGLQTEMNKADREAYHRWLAQKVNKKGARREKNKAARKSRKKNRR